MTDSLVGKTLGRFKITEHLGTGGMADVYKGYQEHLDRFVAIKIMHPFLVADSNFVHRFQREAKAMAALSHPNIVRIFDFDIQGEKTYYLVMEYIEGISLKDYIEESNNQNKLLSNERMVGISIQIAKALAYAHARGMVHRDIKPGNVIIEKDSEKAVLMDFGIVKMLGNQTMMNTVTGALIGTPSYMSPEQAMGKPGDERIDIYSLGIMMFHMITGNLPFDADTPLAVVMKHVQDLPPLPTELNPNVPSGLQEIILKTLAKAPEDRYQTAQELVDKLNDFKNGKSIPSSAPTIQKKQKIAPSIPQSAKNPSSKVTMISIGILTLLAVFILGFFASNRFGTSNNQENTPIIEVEETVDTEIVEEQDQQIADVAPTEPQPTITQTVLEPTSTQTSIPTSISTSTPLPTPTATVDPSIKPPNPQAGTAWIRPIDQMPMIFVPSGEFLMGSPDSFELANPDEKPEHVVLVDSFWIDQLEITNAQFSNFIEETNHITTAEIEGQGLILRDVGWRWQENATWMSPTGPDTSIDGLDDHPVVQVSFSDAMAYCEWAGSTLPSEQQWAFAARGSESFYFPWGNEFDGSLINYCDESCLFDFKDSAFNDNFELTSPVDQYDSGISWIGALDMLGNVWNWTTSDYVAYPGKDPSEGVAYDSEKKVVRGASWLTRTKDVYLMNRLGVAPTSSFYHLGFRCVSSK